MKNNHFKMLIGCLILLVMTNIPATAEDSAVGRFSLGLHGIGSVHADGHPVVSWHLTEGLRLDLTPVIELNDDSGSSEYDREWYGLDIGLTKQLREIRGMRLGFQTLIGYRYGRYDNTYTSGAYSEARFDRYRLGIGPELEYPIPKVPGLSLGAQVMLIAEFSKEDSLNISSYGTYTSASGDTRRIVLTGQVLTVRYRF